MGTKNRKLLIGALALALLAGVFAGVWFATRPETAKGAKTITVEVIHGDGSKKDFTCRTDAEYLAEVLLAEGLAEGTDSEFGLFITKADGEEAEGSAYWAVYQGGEYAPVGVSALPIHDGDSFELVYSVWEG